MAEDRFLIVRMSSLGDIVHTLPASAALRDSFPRARLDWLVDARWRGLLDGNPDINEVVVVDRGAWGSVFRCVRRLRAARYTCVLDFQSLYRSAILAWSSGAPRRVGFSRDYVREGASAHLYTEHVTPRGRHKVEHNLELAARVGAFPREIRFSLRIPAQAEADIAKKLAAQNLSQFYVLSPGGGWRSKCWPAERFGELHHTLARRFGWRGVVSFGPGEKELAEKVLHAAGEPEPVILQLNLLELMAILRRAGFLVAGDTGPLHLASALGTPVVGLYGPTDPARNGPYSSADIVVRNSRPEETTYKRGSLISAAMLSVTVGQVVEAIERRLGLH